MIASSRKYGSHVRNLTLQRNATLYLVGLLLSFVGLATLFASATPPLEASDELWHVGMVYQLATTGELPIQVPGRETLWEQEGSQPPLYYALAAAIVRAIGLPDDFEAARQPNPHAQAGQPHIVGSKNLVLHPTPPETARVVSVGRWLGIALGLITVSAVYSTARVVASQRVALLAAAITAWNPMFLFITASVNNDNLVIALNSVIIWLLVLLNRDGFTVRRALLIGVLVALASLSKLSGLVLVPVIVIVALVVAIRRRDLRGLFILGGGMAASWLLIAAWWYVRNLQLYGELFGTATMAAVAGARVGAFTVGTALAEFEGFRIAYWGWFGAVNIVTHPAFYIVMDAVTGLALVGLIVSAWQRRDRRWTIALLGGIVVLGMGAVIAWTAQTYASQGRLLFPYVAAISTLLALGLWTLVRRAAVIVPALLVMVALAVPLLTIAPAYTPPRPLAGLPASAIPVYARYGDVELVGYETADQRYAPGESIPITVYWRVIQPSARDLSLWLHAISGEAVIGKVDSYPGGGTLRTSTWEPGLYADRYAIPIPTVDAAGGALRIQVGWWDYPTGTLITPQDATGSTLSSVMLDAGAFGVAAPALTLDGMTPVDDVTFGGVIALRGTRQESDHLLLLWEAIGAPDGDYTVFVQVLDEAGQLVASGDGAPDLPTRHWRSGEGFITRHPLLPPGADQRVIVGWYRPDDFMRLPLNRAEFSDNAYRLGV